MSERWTSYPNLRAKLVVGFLAGLLAIPDELLEAARVRREISLEPRDIEAQRRRDVLGAGVGGLPVDGCHWAFPVLVMGARLARYRFSGNLRR